MRRERACYNPRDTVREGAREQACTPTRDTPRVNTREYTRGAPGLGEPGTTINREVGHR